MLFTNPLFSLQSPSSARDKKSTAEDLFMTASARGELGGEKENTVTISTVTLGPTGTFLRAGFRALKKNKKKNKTTSYVSHGNTRKHLP